MKKIHDISYCVDLAAKKPIVESLHFDEWEETLRSEGLESFKDLETHDFKVFDDLIKAQHFLYNYLDTLEELEELTHEKRLSKKLLLKRRWLVTSIMGVKNYTMRTHNRPNIKKGDVIQFYDQTYFLNALITNIETEIINGKKYTRFDYEIKNN